MKRKHAKTTLAMGILIGLSTTFGLTGCIEAPELAPVAAQGDEIVLIASPTPTFVLPDDGDEDPIVDCRLDDPICLINTSIERV